MGIVVLWLTMPQIMEHFMVYTGVILDDSKIVNVCWSTRDPYFVYQWVKLALPYFLSNECICILCRFSLAENNRFEWNQEGESISNWCIAYLDNFEYGKCHRRNYQKIWVHAKIRWVKLTWFCKYNVHISVLHKSSLY